MNDSAQRIQALKAEFNRGQNAAELALDTLRSAIFEGILAPGHRITEHELSDLLGMSRTPIREALAKLQAEGLIEPGARGGLTVIAFGLQEYLATFPAREALEGQAAALACVRCTVADLNRLQFYTDAMQQAASEEDLSGFSRANRLFHRTIWTIAGNPVITRFLMQLQNYALLFHHNRFGSPGREQAAIAEHLLIIQALRDRHAERVERLVKLHVANAREALEQHVETHNIKGDRISW
jgi:DNA-binding GntR family transcriptional regulator